MVISRCLILIESAMLNCVSSFPLSELTTVDVQLLLSALYIHLEKIPSLECQAVVKWIFIQSTLSLVYHLYDFSISGPCLLPHPACVKSIEALTSCEWMIMLRILAKTVLCRLFPYISCIHEHSLILDAIEIQSCVNFVGDRDHRSAFFVCQYMKDLLVVEENRLAFLQWHTLDIVLTAKERCKDPHAVKSLDHLATLLKVPVYKINKVTTERTLICDNCLSSSIDTELCGMHIPLTTVCLSPFDFFICMMKHLVIYVQKTLPVSTILTDLTLNCISVLLEFTCEMMTLDTNIEKRIAMFLADNSICLISLFQLLDQWSELMEFPLFSNGLLVCLVYGSKYDKFCIELGKSKLICRIMHTLTVGVIGDAVQNSDTGLFHALLAIILRCAQKPHMRDALENLRTFDILVHYARSPNIKIRMVAKFNLSFMDHAVYDNSLLQLNEEEIKYYCVTLMEAMEIEGMVASLFYTHQELLATLVSILKSSSKNLMIIVDHCLPTLIELLLISISSSLKVVQRESLLALLNFHTVYKLFPVDLVSLSRKSIDIFSSDNEDCEIRDLAFCIQELIKDTSISTVADALQLTHYCYRAGLFDKCTELCSLAISATAPQTALIKAKCLYHLYRKEHRYLSKHCALLSKQVADEKKRSCYSITEECIKLLSTLLDNNELDAEGSKMLDQSMLDYIDKTNKLYKLKRCLLCRTKGDIKRSHVWPRSLLRRDILNPNDKEISHKKSFISAVSTNSDVSKEQAPGEITYWMFCGKCEQRLSQNGEDHCSKELFDIICAGIGNEDKHVSYGPWLYNFFIGILFRSFGSVSFDFSSEYYSVFLYCRHHLLSLPVKYAPAKEISKERLVSNESLNANTIKQQTECSFMQPGLEPKDFLLPFLLFLPRIAYTNIKSAFKSVLDVSMFNGYTASTSAISLNTGEKDYSVQKHFIYIQLAGMYFVLKLSPSAEYVPPQESTINPTGGRLFIPCEGDRWHYFPEAIKKIIANLVEDIENTALCHFANNASTKLLNKSDLLKSQHVLSSSEKASKEEKDKYSSLEKSSIPSLLNDDHSHRAIVSFLPQDFIQVKSCENVILNLPEFHNILFHVTLSVPVNKEKCTVSVILVAYYDTHFAFPKVYVIMLERKEKFLIAFGAYYEKDSSQKVLINKPLIDMSNVLDIFKDRFRDSCKFVGERLYSLLAVKELDNLELLMQRVYCTRLDNSLMAFQSVDFKCKEFGCWHCAEKCHHCLKTATLGKSMKGVNLKYGVIKFCGDGPCYMLYTSSPDDTPSFTQPLPHESPDSELLLQITKLIGTGWSSNTVLVIQLCINTKSFDTHKGELYVLMQFRTSMLQSFFDFFITKDYKPLDVLYYMSHKKSVILKHRTLFMLMLKLIIEDSLQTTTYQDLDGLLKAHHWIHADKQAQVSKSVKKSDDDDDDDDDDDLFSLFKTN